MLLREEAEDGALGAALAVRTAALAQAGTLGPPDLCYLQKTHERHASKLGGLLLGAPVEGGSDGDGRPADGSIGFYHHVIGLDTSSPAPIAAYIADLAQAHDTHRDQAASFLRASAGWRVRGGVYCCYDAFHEVDLRVRVAIPGGVHVSAVRAPRPTPCGDVAPAELSLPLDGSALSGAEQTELADTWRRVGLSGVLRALCPRPVSPLRALHALPPPLSPEHETAFLDDARTMLRLSESARAQVTGRDGGGVGRSGIGVGFDGGGSADATDGAASDGAISDGMPGDGGPTVLSERGESVDSERADAVAALVFGYFATSHRHEQALRFFVPLAPTLAACACHAAASQRELGLLPDAILCLGTLIERAPTEARALIQQAELLMQCHMLPQARAVASHAVRLAPSWVAAWLLLARAHAALRDASAALRTLNAMPILLLAPMPAPQLAPTPLPPPARYVLSSAAAMALGGSAGDESVPPTDVAGYPLVASDGGGAAAVGVSSACVAAEEEGGTAAAEAAKGAAAEAARARSESYALLAEIARDRGWEAVLEARREAFSMADESRSVTRAAVRSAARATPTEDAADAEAASVSDAAVSDHVDGGSHEVHVGGRAAPSGAAAAAQLPVDATEGFSADKPRCHVWLDALFRKLHADLSALEAWQAGDAAEAAETVAAHDGAAGASCTAHAVGTAGGGAAAAAAAMAGAAASAAAVAAGIRGGEAADAASAASRSLGYDRWLARGELARRMHRPSLARVAYTRAVQGLEEALDEAGGAASAMLGSDETERRRVEQLWAAACQTLMTLHSDGARAAAEAAACAAGAAAPPAPLVVWYADACAMLDDCVDCVQVRATTRQLRRP